MRAANQFAKVTSVGNAQSANTAVNLRRAHPKITSRRATANRMTDDKDSIAAELAQVREQIRALVRPHIGRYAAQINLSCATKREGFERDLIEALLWCIVSHLDAPKRKRFSDIRTDYMRVARTASAAKKHLKSLRRLAGELLTVHLDLAGLESAEKGLGLIEESFILLSDNLKGADKGGAPTKLAYRSLVRGLKLTFERATGRQAKVTWNPYRSRYEGSFFGFVEAVLPLAQSFADAANRPMDIPTAERARGKYVYEMTRSPRSKQR
jgi:hypothetical protein